MDVLFGFHFSPKSRSTELDLLLRSQRGCKTAQNARNNPNAGLATLIIQTQLLKSHQRLHRVAVRAWERVCVSASAYVINHVKSQGSRRQRYMVIALTRRSLLRLWRGWRERERGDKRWKEREKREREKVEEVSGKDCVNVTGGQLLRALRQHGKLRDITLRMC